MPQVCYNNSSACVNCFPFKIGVKGSQTLDITAAEIAKVAAVHDMCHVYSLFHAALDWRSRHKLDHRED